MKENKVETTVNAVDTEKLVHYAKISEERLFTKLNTTRSGLTQKMADRRLEKFGKNEITHDKPDAWYIKLLKSFMNPFTVILVSLALVSFILDYVLAPVGAKDASAVIVILTMVILSGVIGFIQEFRADKSALKLKSLVTTTITVARLDKGVKTIEEDISKLVQGDVVHLAAGDMILSPYMHNVLQYRITNNSKALFFFTP